LFVDEVKFDVVEGASLRISDGYRDLPVGRA